LFGGVGSGLRARRLLTGLLRTLWLLLLQLLLEPLLKVLAGLP